MNLILFDTSIFGEIIIDNKVDIIREKIKKSDSFYIFGNRVVRNGLRVIDKKVKIDGKSLRNLLLSLYDEICKNSFIVSRRMENLAEEYFSVYKEVGGVKGKKVLINDFRIVACASIKELDIVVSKDSKTVFDEKAIKAYSLVNKIKKKRTPKFILYKEVKDMLRGSQFNKSFDNSPKLWVFHVFFILFPDILFFYNMFHNVKREKAVYKFYKNFKRWLI